MLRYKVQFYSLYADLLIIVIGLRCHDHLFADETLHLT